MKLRKGEIVKEFRGERYVARNGMITYLFYKKKWHKVKSSEQGQFALAYLRDDKKYMKWYKQFIKSWL